MNSLKKFSAALLLILFLIVAMFFTWFYSQIDGALPTIQGKVSVFGLTKSVTVNRDINGVPTLIAKNRTDLAIATGFIHAQERFFQMDTLRRNAAGELSSLFGQAALEYDKSVRVHRFRHRANTIIKQLPKEQLDILTAYTTGVNEGLKRLHSKPFEYLLLQQDPVEWQSEDSILAVFSMYMDLQHKDGRRERTLGELHKMFQPSVYSFLNPKGSIWDAAIDGSIYKQSPLPNEAWPSASFTANNNNSFPDEVKAEESEGFPGSNNWAVSGNLSKTGSAIVANDMHLNIRVPNTWYRASFHYQQNDQTVKLTGVTLPGTPIMVIGSNENIAWGFTNSYGDYNDVIVLKTNEDRSQYLTPQGYMPFTEHKQVIAIKDQLPVEINIKETIWGPVITDDKKEMLAYRWVAHDVNAVNLAHLGLEQAKTVSAAFKLAHKAGIPAQNMVVGDSDGNIGWTIMGPIPKRTTSFGEVPEDWSTGKFGWQGYVDSIDYPQIINPSNNRLWTANSRVVGGKMLATLGNGGYALGARSTQIRDALFAKELFLEQDLLDIALDDRALFLDRWHNFIIEDVLTDEILIQNPQWREAKTLLLQESELTASIDSVSYRLVRNFRINLRNKVFNLLSENIKQKNEQLNLHAIRHQLEIPLWQLITQQPDNFPWLSEDSWQNTFTEAFTTTYDAMTDGQQFLSATWGQQNTANIKHPISKAVPFLSRWLDMPQTPLAGDSYMPRVQGQSFGASQRMIVSPGHENNGIFHMPTSQSGHPWSPYFGKGHQHWEQGKPSPFLPGDTHYSLTLLSY